jgi:hypothetical protein
MTAPDRLRGLLPDTEEEICISGWEPVDLGPYLRGEIVVQPPTLFARNDGVKLLYPGRLNLFIGETETAKTWLVVHVAAGELKAGHHVIFLDYEDGGETVVERLRALGVSDEAIDTWLTYINPEGVFGDLERAIVTAAIERRGAPTLVIIDSITDAMTALELDPNSGPDVTTYYNGSPRWHARMGAAVAMIDHVTKSSDGRGRWAIGSERKISKADGAAYNCEELKPFGRGKRGLIQIRVAKDRPGHVRQHEDHRRVIAPADLESFPDGGVSIHVGAPETATDASFRPTHIMSKVYATIVAQPGLSKRALRAAVQSKGTTTDLALELLISEGYVEARPGPNRSLQHYAIKHYPGV